MAAVDPVHARLMVRGENGHAAHSAAGLGDSLLAFFDKLLRGLPEDRVRIFVADVLREARSSADAETVKNLFVLAFQTRWCRGGKGERQVALVLLKVLYEIFPAVVLELVEQLPAYGAWKDPLALLLECHHRGGGGGDANVDYSALQQRVWALFARQLQADWSEVEAARTEGRAPRALSLCAKFAPSEGGEHSRVLGADKAICALPFPAVVGSQVAAGEAAWHHARAKYRRMVSGLRKALVVPEVYMCAERWAELEFDKVPSLCLDHNKRAFLNETKEGAVRRPDDADRVSCRERLLSTIVEKGVAALKGKQLFPHELVQQVLQRKRGPASLSSGVTAVLDAQWETVRKGLLDMVAARKEELSLAAAPLETVDALSAAATLCPDVAALDVAKHVAMDAAVSSGAAKPVGLSRVVPMSDVSLSMVGTPMFVSIALGILMSEVTHPSFRDKVLTFESTPLWHDLSSETSFVSKAQSLAKASWGRSTNFYAAMCLIAELVRKDKLEQHDIPDLLVVSDMQFNEALEDRAQAAAGRSSWDSAYDKISQLFHTLGLEMHGRPLHAPKIIFWNVRSDTVGYPAAADQKGVMLLSGFSPALMKFILSGEMEQEVVVGVDAQGHAVKEKTQVDPREALARVLHDSGLDAVRAVLDHMPRDRFLSPGT